MLRRLDSVFSLGFQGARFLLALGNISRLYVKRSLDDSLGILGRDFGDYDSSILRKELYRAPSQGPIMHHNL